MDGKRLMETTEAADYTGTNKDYVANQAKLGHIAYILTSPKKVMFDRADLDAWMNGWRRVEATAR